MKKNVKILIGVITAILIVIVFIVIAFIGLRSYIAKNKRLIEDYLSEKYDEKFTVTKVGNAFNGNDLWYKYAIAKSHVYEEKIFIYCYPNSNNQGDKIYLNGKEHVIVDNYAEIEFQNQIQNELEKKINDEVFLKCEIAFSNYSINNEEYKKGLKYCLDDEGIASHITIYAIARNEKEMATIRKIVEEYCLEYNAYRQYLYFAIAPYTDEKTVMKHYKEDSNSFDYHLNNCNEISHVEFTLIKRNEGITKKSVEKQ